MTRVIFFAVLAFLSVGHVFGQYDGYNPEAELIQMDMEAAANEANVDPSSKPETTETEPAPRQFLVGGYGGYGGLGGFGGYGLGGYGLGGGLGYGGLSSGLCTRSCFGLVCRRICRNRVFFDEDPEESQDSNDSDDELTEDEMDDLSMEDESDDTDAQDDHMIASTKSGWHSKNSEKKLRSASCNNPSHGHSSSERNRLEILESSRPSIPASKWSREKHYREITESGKPEISASSNWNTEHRFREQSESSRPAVSSTSKWNTEKITREEMNRPAISSSSKWNTEKITREELNRPELSSSANNIRELHKSGKKVIVVPHEIFQTLRPSDILVREKYITNPDGSRTWTKFATTSETSMASEKVNPLVINSNKVASESTIANSGSMENSKTAWEKHHSSKEESSRGNFFNPSSAMLDRFTSVRSREEVQPSSLRETSQTEFSSSRREELERQEKLERREEMEQQFRREQQEKREEIKRRRELERLEFENQRKWSHGSSRREGLETSSLESSRLPTVNSGENMMSKKEWKMMKKMHHRRHHPVIIIMDEDQMQDQEQQPEV